MSRRDLINRIASLEGSRDYWLQDRPEMTATDWANLCEEDADELRELQARLAATDTAERRDWARLFLEMLP
jgi:hypothetical protein